MRRTHHDVKAGILKSCSSTSLSISQLLYGQNLSYKILRPCLDHLASRGLIEYEIDRRRKLVRTTELGLTAYLAYQNALTLLEGKGPAPFNRSSIPDQVNGSWNIVMEQKDRTILPRTIMIKQ